MDDPARMSTEQRMRELAGLFARGILRLRLEPGRPEVEPETSPACLAVPSHIGVSVPGGSRPREALPTHDSMIGGDT